jgi:hypothetical protein
MIGTTTKFIRCKVPFTAEDHTTRCLDDRGQPLLIGASEPIISH